MHGELALLAGAIAGVASGAVAILLHRSAAVRERLATLSDRFAR